MNIIKSTFIGMYPMLAMGIAGYGIYRIATDGLDIGWAGAVLATLPTMLFFSRVMIFQNMARTTSHFPLLTILAVAGEGLAGYHYYQAGAAAQSALLATTVGLIGFLLYNFWYSVFDRSGARGLKTGSPLPSFSVSELDGSPFRSDQLLGKPAVVLFYRGNWCPLCMAQIKEIAAQYRELSDRGATVALISPQPDTKSKALAAKFDVPFLFLTDKDNHAARSLGVEFDNGLPMGMQALGYDLDTVLPTVIVTDAEGKIIYCDMTDNYRIRPEPEEYIRVLDRHLGYVS